MTIQAQAPSTFHLPDLLQGRHRILITGGAGFIGGAVVRRLLRESNAIVFNLDKLGYASDLTSIEEVLAESGPDAGSADGSRHRLLHVDLTDPNKVSEAVRVADPDLVMHLAAESHVDRSIEGPGDFVASNVNGTFHLLEAVRVHWEGLKGDRKRQFRFHHISTDEVFGSLGEQGRFSESTPYDPRSPYSASKAASDHLVSAWHHTYGLPVVLTNCSNNYGPWQFPEKLIPVVILKAAAQQPIPLYGDGKNVRDWLYVEDHVDGLLLAANKGKLGDSYCIGGHGERTNKEVVLQICSIMDEIQPLQTPHHQLISTVADRPGHDLRYAIDPYKISTELGWQPRHNFEVGLKETVHWYCESSEWVKNVQARSGYTGGRIGIAPPVTTTS